MKRCVQFSHLDNPLSVRTWSGGFCEVTGLVLTSRSDQDRTVRRHWTCVPHRRVAPCAVHQRF